MPKVYIGLGSNLGDREKNLSLALEKLSEAGRVVAISSIYETQPWGYKDQPWFLNVVCEIETDLSPQDLLKALKQIEKEMGREPGPRFGPRPIDLDILLYDDLVVDTPDLTIPHPRLAERRFMLTPLAEIAPTVQHPLLKKSAQALLDSLPGRGTVRLHKRRIRNSPASS